MSLQNDVTEQPSILRVEINLKTNFVSVDCFEEVNCVDKTILGYYGSPDDLPDWVQNKLAVLMTVDSTPPTQPVEGVGQRISRNVFWVYRSSADER
jgi:hypothetical protein